MIGFSSVLSRHGDGVRLVVKARPGTSRTRPPRLVPLAAGGQAVEIAVSAPPEDGKANKAILSFLASSLDLKKNSMSIKSGAFGRLKLVELESDNPEKLETKVRLWLQKIEHK